MLAYIQNCHSQKTNLRLSNQNFKPVHQISPHKNGVFTLTIAVLKVIWPFIMLIPSRFLGRAIICSVWNFLSMKTYQEFVCNQLVVVSCVYIQVAGPKLTVSLLAKFAIYKLLLFICLEIPTEHNEKPHKLARLIVS